jgi:glucose/arabinose dehydrogenase
MPARSTARSAILLVNGILFSRHRATVAQRCRPSGRLAGWLCTVLLAMATATAAAQSLPLDRIRLPAGFSIALFAEGVQEARSMALGRNNVLFVSSRNAGKVHAIRYRDNRATQVITIASGLNMPNGIALRDGALYVAEVNRILRFDDVEARLDAYASKSRSPVVVTDRFPSDRHHGWKFVRFGPDGMLYVPVGAPCNICVPDPDRYALIARIRPDGSGYEVVARGVRNSVGFDWHPETKELWFTDNGRDMLGDDLPSDELNRVTATGQHFGYPYCHQGDTPDPDLAANGQGRGCSAFTPPALKLGAHVASLGMRFYTGTQFPAAYRNSMIIAEHGSWNRSKKSGYRLVRAVIEGNSVRQEVFAEGWLENERSWGRPVDVEQMPDGSLLVSDDQAGVIYRISYAR